MKNIILIVGLAVFFSSCGNKSNENPAGETADSTKKESASFFGEKISEDDAVEATSLTPQITGKDSMNVKLKGKIVEVCQKKGCWMKVDLGNNQTMRVSFKDYSFFVPKDAAGKNTVIEGWAYNDTTSVEALKHFAEDAGESAEEIAKITEPEPSITFEAKGVVIYNE